MDDIWVKRIKFFSYGQFITKKLIIVNIYLTGEEVVKSKVILHKHALNQIGLLKKMRCEFFKLRLKFIFIPFQKGLIRFILTSDIKLVQILLNHSDVRLLLRYTQLAFLHQSPLLLKNSTPSPLIDKEIHMATTCCKYQLKTSSCAKTPSHLLPYWKL